MDNKSPWRLIHLLSGRLAAAIQARRLLTEADKQTPILPVIDRWIGQGRGNHDDRKAIREYLDLTFPQ